MMRKKDNDFESWPTVIAWKKELARFEKELERFIKEHRQFRRERGVTDQEIARRLGISIPGVHKREESIIRNLRHHYYRHFAWTMYTEGFTESEIAFLLKVSQTTVNRWLIPSKKWLEDYYKE